MKNVVPVRKALGVRTVFNILGPMLNPASCGRAVIGVYSEPMVTLMAHALHELGAELTLVVHCGGARRHPSAAHFMTHHVPIAVTTAVACSIVRLAPPDVYTPRGIPTRPTGLDELAPIAVATVATVTPSGVTMGTIDPFQLGFPKCTIDDLKGGDATTNAEVLRQVFCGQLAGPRLGWNRRCSHELSLGPASPHESSMSC